MEKVYKALEFHGINSLDPLTNKSIRIINKWFRLLDESHLYPIRNRFNVTDRAIRWYQRVYFKANGNCSAMEYIEGLNGFISDQVNSI